MIGAVRATKNHALSLQTLEEIWKSEHSKTDILSTLQPTLIKVLLRKDEALFLDTMKFVALLVSELYEKVDVEVLGGFTERFLSAAHSTANRYYHSHTFDQNRYLDCVAAILSVWTDCTDKDHLIIPKFIVYTRESKVHVLDAILQSIHLKSLTKDKLLDQISSLSNVEIFVKYTIIGRVYPKHHLHSISEQPAEDTFRCWLLKHNTTAIGSVSEFLSSDRADEDLLSAMCRPFYSLPPVSEETMEVVEEVIPEVNPDTLFFIDRGDRSESKKENSTENKKKPEEEKMSVEENIPPVSVEPEPTETESETVSVVTELDRPDDSSNDDQKEAGTVAVIPVEEPVAQPVEEPVAQPVEEPAPQPVEEPVAQPVEEAVAQPEVSESCIKIRNLRKGRGIPPTPSSEVIVVNVPTTRTATPAVQQEGECSSSAPLTEERLASLPDKPSVRSTRRRKNSDASVSSVGSATSVDSIASRTRNRTRIAPPESLEVITEHEEGTKDVAVSGRKVRTPAVKNTPQAKQSTASKRRQPKISETIDETPQIPVRKTRSRKLDV